MGSNRHRAEMTREFGQMILMDGYAAGTNLPYHCPGSNAKAFSRHYNDPWYTEVIPRPMVELAGVNAVVALGIHGQFINQHNVR